MIDINFMKDFLVPVIVAICLCVGFAVKKIDVIPNKYIPLIVMILGLVCNIIANIDCIDLNVIACGMTSGLASTGLYELFDKLINGNKVEEVNHEK